MYNKSTTAAIRTSGRDVRRRRPDTPDQKGVGEMNPVIEAIKCRRSVRSYKATPVPQELIEAIIDAGNWAPTGNNRQPWRFVVVQESDFIGKLTKAALPTWKRLLDSWRTSDDEDLREYFTDFFPKCLGWPRQSFEDTMRQARDLGNGIYWDAPVAIFVIGTSGRESALVCENMMIAAQSLGLGTCIVGFGTVVTDDEEVVQAFQLKGNEKIHDCVVVGYPQIVPGPPKKRDPEVIWI
jgi:nitroreductase